MGEGKTEEVMKYVVCSLGCSQLGGLCDCLLSLKNTRVDSEWQMTVKWTDSAQPVQSDLLKTEKLLIFNIVRMNQEENGLLVNQLRLLEHPQGILL